MPSVSFLATIFSRTRSYGNGGLGIDLGGDGVTANDTGDADSGPNNLQNFPVLGEVVNTAVAATVFGSLNSTPRTKFLLQFFADTAADPSGHGEGRTFLGEAIVQTDSAGNVSFAAPLPAPIPADQMVTATATRLVDLDGDPATPQLPRETSEFSRAISAVTPELRLGETLTPDLAPGQELRFRLNVPVGTDARLRVTFADPRLGEIFIRQGALPGTEAFAFHSIGFLDPSPVFLLAGSPLPYFIILSGTSTSAVPAARVTLTAEEVGHGACQRQPGPRQQCRGRRR